MFPIKINSKDDIPRDAKVGSIYEVKGVMWLVAQTWHGCIYAGQACCNFLKDGRAFFIDWVRDGDEIVLKESWEHDSPYK